MPTRTRTATKKDCPDCKGEGEIREAVRVGARKRRVTADRQTAMCTTCWGSGKAQ